ncbi:MAG: hypothetical protein FWF82_03625 [Oscillospiraceae bacterium]|nr:hypothetical protein [Oscillospiraceae bacterium]
MNNNNKKAEKIWESLEHIGDDKITESESAVVVNSPWRMFAPFAAALVLIAGFASAIYFGAGRDDTVNPYDPDSSDSASSVSKNTSVKGLPARDFTIDNLGLDVFIDRNVITKFTEVFGSVFNYFNNFGIVTRTVIVRVESIEGNLHISDYVRVRARVIENIYGDGEEVINLKPVYAGDGTIPHTDLYREGGVYVLSLCERDGISYPIGEWDVLFEIDDNENVFSHSRNPEFNYFDGKNYTVLTDEIRRLFGNEEYIASPITYWLKHSPLAEVVVTEATLRYEDDYAVEKENPMIYMFYQAEVIQNINSRYNGEILPNRITIAASTQDFPYWGFKEGVRYIVPIYSFTFPTPPSTMVSGNDNEIFQLYSYDYAEINDNGVICGKTFDEDNTNSVFSHYDGYTLDEFKQSVERLLAFDESFTRTEWAAEYYTAEQKERDAIEKETGVKKVSQGGGSVDYEYKYNSDFGDFKITARIDYFLYRSELERAVGARDISNAVTDFLFSREETLESVSLIWINEGRYSDYSTFEEYGDGEYIIATARVENGTDTGVNRERSVGVKRESDGGYVVFDLG